MQPRERDEQRSLGQILKELSSETSTLLRQEVDLAKTEMSEKASRVGSNLGSAGGGRQRSRFCGALALLYAVVYGLTSLLGQFMSIRRLRSGWPRCSWASCSPSSGTALIKKALATLRQESLTPRRTTQSLQENKEWLKSKIQ